ncbi:flavin reductase [Afipia sp. P52-10]|uniref:flavin reductase family protein n=1 Tax=Afipia sp. P52-10 TaxID=1429916 RepID=UPI0003DF1B04|nr:flavin reductase family protein [Afipia sp. P52-10]ETR78072.1 flavin reductase [Afipia sp. P52-10]
MDTFELAGLTPALRYKLLAGLVVPRPIALITTVSDAGVVNAAPYSFFNVFSEDPPIVVVGLQSKDDLSLKDTARNVRSSGEFVVNMVDEDLAVAMNDCAIDFPPERGEPSSLQLSLAQSHQVAVPRLVRSPVALECRKVTMMNFGVGRDLLVGEVLVIQAREGVIDPQTLRTEYARYSPVGRLTGFEYTRTHDRFQLMRESFAAWSERVKDGTSAT